MPIFHPPQYSKVTNSTTGVVEPCYTFKVEYTPSDTSLHTIAEDESVLSLSGLEQVIQANIEWWDRWTSSFLESAAKHFSKPYTVQHIRKITKHQLIGKQTLLFPANVEFIPQTIQIRSGIFWVTWGYYMTPITIEIPDIVDEEETLPVSNSAKEELEELRTEDLVEEEHATDMKFTLDTPAQFYEKRKAKESRLKAKLAMYRAQYQLNKYYQKYGTEVSDSDTEDEMSEEATDEVQL
jgi:hypothetical protein